jgi:predicted RNA-binding Zn-ribbon protein involved in translation (DUF1610 family)
MEQKKRKILAKRMPDVTINCVTCGKEFITRASKARNGAKYCSRQCCSIATTKNVTITCLHCSKPFQVKPYTAKFAKYCGHACKGAAMRKVKEEAEVNKKKRNIEDENDRSWAKPLPLFGSPW